SISQSYAMGSVSGNNNLGGLVGWQNFGSISDSYWNTETTGQGSAVGGREQGTITNVQGLSTTDMFQSDNFSGFDFNTVWANAGNQTTPFLRGLAGNQVINRNDLPAGSISPSNSPNLYTVLQNVEQLQAVQNDLAGRYVLGNEIDASNTVGWNCDATGSNCEGFAPVGRWLREFTGVFDGLGHGIKGLFIYRPSTDQVG